jgi:hypothetical protein
MQKFLLLLFLGILAVILSCSGSSFVKTGKTYEKLPKNSVISVFLDSIPPHEEIGRITCDGLGDIMGIYTIERAIEQAKISARKNGGNCVIFYDVYEVFRWNEEESSPHGVSDEAKTFAGFIVAKCGIVKK